MSISGVSVEEETIKIFEEMRFRQQAGGLILNIKEGKIEIEREVDGDFNGMVGSLPDAEPRFILYDVPMSNRAGIDVVKTVFIFWLPMESPVRMRMEYASSKAIITKEFRGIATQLQEDDKSELTIDYTIAKVNKTQGINRAP